MASEAVEEEQEKTEESFDLNVEPGGNKWPAPPRHYFSVASIASAAPIDDPDEQMEDTERNLEVQTRLVQKGVAKMERETYAMGERLDELIFDATNYKMPIELQEVTKAVKERCELWKTNVKLATDVGESDAKGASQGKESQIKETDFGGKERGVTTEDSAKSTDTSNRPVSASGLQLGSEGREYFRPISLPTPFTFLFRHLVESSSADE
ncbi:hypothetical protein BC629DRAFT_267796 [Irpex lacteus]|nr:hypothetical protein BC629DRAFT_267796 [Irpex lacteus]